MRDTPVATDTEPKIPNPAAQALGRRRWIGKTDAEKVAFANLGARARAEKLSAKSRKDISRKAAAASAKVRSAKAARLRAEKADEKAIADATEKSKKSKSTRKKAAKTSTS